MWQAIGQYVGGKVLTAILIVASAGGIIWFWRHPEQLASIWTVIKYVLVWLGFVIVLPWAGFLVTAWVVKKDSNLAAGALLAGYLLLDVVVAVALSGGWRHNFLTWCVLLLGFLSAGVYNFLVCDFQAARIEEST